MSVFRRGDRARIDWPGTPLHDHDVTILRHKYFTQSGYNILLSSQQDMPPVQLWIATEHLSPTADTTTLVPLTDATREA